MKMQTVFPLQKIANSNLIQFQEMRPFPRNHYVLQKGLDGAREFLWNMAVVLGNSIGFVGALKQQMYVLDTLLVQTK